jgi:hypothetical protein
VSPPPRVLQVDEKEFQSIVSWQLQKLGGAVDSPDEGHVHFAAEVETVASRPVRSLA